MAANTAPEEKTAEEKDRDKNKDDVFVFDEDYKQPHLWKVTVADCAADNGLHGRLVVGAQIPVEELDGLAARLPGVEVELAVVVWHVSQHTRIAQFNCAQYSLEHEDSLHDHRRRHR